MFVGGLNWLFPTLVTLIYLFTSVIGFSLSIFEVGGKNKGNEQIMGLKNAYLALDNLNTALVIKSRFGCSECFIESVIVHRGRLSIPACQVTKCSYFQKDIPINAIIRKKTLQNCEYSKKEVSLRIQNKENMKRLLFEKLKEWKNSASRQPLILRGARQVGKTWLMKAFAETEYQDYIYTCTIFQ